MSTIAALFLAGVQLWPQPSPPSDEVVDRVKALAPNLIAADAGVRARAAQQLLALGPEATEVLIDMTRTAEPPELDAIRETLPKYGPPAIERLYWAPGRSLFMESKARDEAEAGVARMGEAAIPELKRYWDAGYESPLVFAIGILRRMGSAGVEHAIPLLRHPNKDVRSSVAGLLAIQADPRSADALIEGLKSDDPVVRMYAAVGLGNLRDRRSMDSLLDLLSDSNWGPREAASAALAKMYEPRFLPRLVQLARNDPEVGVRDTAANALMLWTKDPIAERLGRRYRPRTTSFVRELSVDLAAVIRFLMTASVMYLLMWGGVKLSRQTGPWGVPRAVWWSAAAILLMGFVWGRVIVGVSGLVEWLLLGAVVPGTSWLGWWWGPSLKALRLPAWFFGLVVVVILSIPAVGLMWWLVLMYFAPRVLAVLLAVALVVAWWRGRKAEAEERRPFRRATLIGTAAFYLGYGIGWLALWGYLGV